MATRAKYRTSASDIFESDLESDDDDCDSNYESDVGDESDFDAAIWESDSNFDNNDDNSPTNNISNRHRNTTTVIQRRARKENIVKAKHGPSRTAKNLKPKSKADVFSLFFTDAMIDMIVKCTNKKGERHYSAKNIEWKPTDKIEIHAFFAVLLISGRFRQHKEDVNDMWRTNNLMSRSIYRAVMSRNRFRELFTMIRFDDIDTREERVKRDKLAAVRDLTELFAQQCRKMYTPSGDLTVDEQLVSFRGNCRFRVYIKSKPGRYGIKIWVLADAANAYGCNFQIYIGKIFDQAEKNQGERVVKDLIAPWEGKGFNVTCDNFFTGVSLAHYLLQKQTTLVGTVRKNRKLFPKKLWETKGREEFSSYFLRNRNVTIVSYMRNKTKCVVLLSTAHHDNETAGPEKKCKPQIILDYNGSKGGVDTQDKLLLEYRCRRGTRRWPWVVAMNLLDMAALNSYVLWTFFQPGWVAKEGKKRARKVFLEELGVELAKPYIVRRGATIEERGGCYFKKGTTVPMELAGVQIKKKRSTTKPRGRCHLCVDEKIDNKHSSKCDDCKQWVCTTHSKQTHTVVCRKCQPKG